MAELLRARGLIASYGATQVLFGIDFELAAGQITAILGANGAGKTTTLRAICQMVRTGGSVQFEGKELVGQATENVVRLGVAHVPDGRGTFAELTTEENLRLVPTPGPTAPRSHATWSAPTRVFRAWPSGECSRPARSRAASSRCSPSAAR